MSETTCTFVHKNIDGFVETVDTEDQNENKNTKRKTETDMRICKAYLVSLDESREPETIPPIELDRHLSTYFSIIKKHDGNEYEAASLRGMLCSIERYLRSHNYPVSLTRDIEFTNTRNMLKQKQKVLRELAKPEKKEKDETHASIAVHRLNQLYLAKEFGPHNASSVVNALCFSFVVHLKMKKAIDHKQLLWGDIVLLNTAMSEEYLCYSPLAGYEYCRIPLKGITALRVPGHTHESTLWDPVSMYKLYRSKRPVSMLSPESPFYLGVSTAPHENGELSWYKPIAMGVNKLNDLVRMIRDITGSVFSNQEINNSSFRETDQNTLENLTTDEHGDYYAKHHERTKDIHSLAKTIADSARQTDEDNDNQSDSDNSRSSYNPIGNSNEMDETSAIEGDNELISLEQTPHGGKDGQGVKIDTDNEETESHSRTIAAHNNLLDEAKQKITDVLESLDADTKRELTKWMRRLDVEKGTHLHKEPKEGRLSFNVSFNVDRQQVFSRDTSLLAADVQINSTMVTPGQAEECIANILTGSTSGANQQNKRAAQLHSLSPTCTTPPSLPGIPTSTTPHSLSAAPTITMPHSLSATHTSTSQHSLSSTHTSTAQHSLSATHTSTTPHSLSAAPTSTMPHSLSATHTSTAQHSLSAAPTSTPLHSLSATPISHSLSVSSTYATSATCPTPLSMSVSSTSTTSHSLSTTSTCQSTIPLKRAMSYPGDQTLYKFPKLANTEKVKATETETSNDRHSETITDTCTNKQTLTRGFDGTQRFPGNSLSGNMVPCPSWPYDPRIALFLRDDVIQTYQNFVGMFNNVTNKANVPGN